MTDISLVDRLCEIHPEIKAAYDRFNECEIKMADNRHVRNVILSAIDQISSILKLKDQYSSRFISEVRAEIDRLKDDVHRNDIKFEHLK